jgi:oligopeptide/dipeptide ABC transporter ATP-binding protein
MSDALLSAREVAVDIGGREALTAVDLEVRRGECVGVVGETGSGKTLTARTLTGTLARIDAVVTGGSVEFDGIDLVGLSDKGWRALRGRRIALVPQSSLSGLDPLMSVGKQLTETIRALAEDADPRRRALELLELVQMPRPDELLRLYPHQLSGGMRQRIMIAFAMVGDPDLIVADEPTTALDVTVQRDILDLLASLTRERGMSLVLISHDLSVVKANSQSVVIMYAGMTVERGATSTVLPSPAHPYTRALLAAGPGEVASGERLVAIPGMPPSLDARPPGCRFNPRCEFVRDECRAEVPALREARAGQAAACIRLEELPA